METDAMSHDDIDIFPIPEGMKQSVFTDEEHHSIGKVRAALRKLPREIRAKVKVVSRKPPTIEYPIAISRAIDIGVWGYTDGIYCPACGGDMHQRRGTAISREGRRYRLQCQNCGRWFLGGKHNEQGAS
jgi:hypothetical protein